MEKWREQCTHTHTRTRNCFFFLEFEPVESAVYTHMCSQRKGTIKNKELIFVTCQFQYRGGGGGRGSGRRR